MGKNFLVLTFDVVIDRGKYVVTCPELSLTGKFDYVSEALEFIKEVKLYFED